MPVGQPDWYASGQSQDLSTSIDIGELAARLGSAINYDRTGKLLFQDTFTRLDGLWVVTDGGISVAPAVDTTYAEYDDSALKTTLNIGVANYFVLSKYFRMWQDSFLSIEISNYSAFRPDAIKVAITKVQDQIAQYFNAWFYSGLTALKVLKTGLAWDVVFTGHTYEYDTHRFNTIKLDVDFANNYYRQVSVDDKVYDLSTYESHQAAFATPNVCLIDLSFYGHATQALVHYLDRVILTIDE
jgi:hypothetical protein